MFIYFACHKCGFAGPIEQRPSRPMQCNDEAGDAIMGDVVVIGKLVQSIKRTRPTIKHPDSVENIDAG